MYSKLIIVGNLGRDPEMRFSPSGTPVTNLNVASNRVYKNGDGEKVTEVTWYRVSVWGKAAEAAAQYLSKGRAVLVEGRLVPDKTTGGPKLFDRQDGSKGASFEVFAESVKFLGGGNHTDAADGSAVETSAPSEMSGGEDQIPF